MSMRPSFTAAAAQLGGVVAGRGSERHGHLRQSRDHRAPAHACFHLLPSPIPCRQLVQRQLPHRLRCHWWSVLTPPRPLRRWAALRLACLPQSHPCCGRRAQRPAPAGTTLPCRVHCQPPAHGPTTGLHLALGLGLPSLSPPDRLPQDPHPPHPSHPSPHRSRRAGAAAGPGESGLDRGPIFLAPLLCHLSVEQPYAREPEPVRRAAPRPLL